MTSEEFAALCVPPGCTLREALAALNSTGRGVLLDVGRAVGTDGELPDGFAISSHAGLGLQIVRTLPRGERRMELTSLRVHEVGGELPRAAAEEHVRQRVGGLERVAEVGRAEHGHEPEEDEDHHLAEAEVAVGLRTAGVEPRSCDAHRADDHDGDVCVPRWTTRSHRPSSASEAARGWARTRYGRPRGAKTIGRSGPVHAAASP